MKRILICEDDAAVATITCRILEHAGYKVTRAASATEAVRRMENRNVPNLLITDLILPPPISGIELTHRALALIPPLPVIVMTGYETEEQREMTDRLQSVVLLQKPVVRQTLLDTVAGLING